MAKKNKESATLLTSKEPTALNGTPKPDAIAARAFQYYVQDGRVEGRDLEYWLRAERDLNQELQNGSGKGKNVTK